MSKIYVSPNAYLGRSETFFCRDSVEVFKLQYVEEKCATNASSPGGDASSPGGDASPRRHCQLGARCPKLAILELVIFMYL